MQGGAGVLRVRGAWAPFRFLELGAEVAATAEHLDSIERQAAHGRAGLGWGRASLGSGLVIADFIVLGLRGNVEAAPRTLGLDAIDGGARSLAFGGELAIGALSEHVLPLASYALSWVRGDGGWTTVFTHRLGGVLRLAGRFHPLFDVELRFGWADAAGGGQGILHAGTLIDLARGRQLRVTVDLAFPGNSEGAILGVTLALFAWPAPYPAPASP
jgi:hypothetical protein